MKMKKVVAFHCVLLQFCVFYMGALGRVPSKCKKYQFPARNELQKCRCGLANEGRKRGGLPEHKIVSGFQVLPGNKYPWMARLHNQFGDFFCGAAMISPSFLLTAAHCNDGEQIPVMAMFPTSMGDYRIRVPVRRVVNHPRYRDDFAHDIAIVQLKHPLKCTPDSRPICVNHMRQLVSIGTRTIAAGWGQYHIGIQEEDLPSSSYLRETPMTISSFKACKCPRADYCFCAKGSGTVCFGDSGGPLFKRYRGKFYILGISSCSNQNDCNPRGLGDIFTRVDYYYNWISKHVNSGRL